MLACTSFTTADVVQIEEKKRQPSLKKSYLAVRKDVAVCTQIMWQVSLPGQFMASVIAAKIANLIQI